MSGWLKPKKDKETRKQVQGNESKKERKKLLVHGWGSQTVRNIPSQAKSGVDHGSIDGCDLDGIGW